MLRTFFAGLLFILLSHTSASGQSMMMIPMDEDQTNHLKAYGLAYFVLQTDSLSGGC